VKTPRVKTPSVKTAEAALDRISSRAPLREASAPRVRPTAGETSFFARNAASMKVTQTDHTGQGTPFVHRIFYSFKFSVDIGRYAPGYLRLLLPFHSELFISILSASFLIGQIMITSCDASFDKGRAGEAPPPGETAPLPLILDRLIGERAQIIFRQVEAHHRLGHEETDQILLRIDPVLGLRCSGPAELAD
jgi:hypothetical protein